MNRRSLALLGLALLLGAAEGARMLWGRTARQPWRTEPVLSCSFPSEIPRGDLEGSRAGEILSQDAVEVLKLSGRAGERWEMELVYLIYDAGNKRYLHDIFAHSPEICMRGSGARLEQVLSPKRLRIDDQSFLVRHLVFRNAITDRPVHLFKFVWIGGMKTIGLDGTETDLRMVRLKAARARQGAPPAFVILAQLAGARSEQAAWIAFRDAVIPNCRFVARPGQQ